MRPARAVAAAVLAVVLSGCTGTPGPGEAKIDVDTPELREAKVVAGVEPCVPGDPAEGPVDDGLPAVTLPCFGGGPDVALGDLRGPMVVNVWAAWCGPCREEMPVLQAFHEEYADRVPLIGIDYIDTQVVGAMELVQETGVTYPLLADPQGDLQGAGPFPGRMGLPLTAFVDEEGVASLYAGEIESIDQLRDLVAERLGVTLR